MSGYCSVKIIISVCVQHLCVDDLDDKVAVNDDEDDGDNNNDDDDDDGDDEEDKVVSLQGMELSIKTKQDGKGISFEITRLSIIYYLTLQFR